MGEEEITREVIWNFDDSQSKLIFGMKLDFIAQRDDWNLENMYWRLLSLFSEAEPMFDDSVKDELQSLLDKITLERKKTNGFKDLDNEVKADCWLLMNNFYRRICEEMVNNNYYYRKKQSYVGL